MFYLHAQTCLDHWKEAGTRNKCFLDIAESQVWIAYPKVGLEKQAALRRTIGLHYQHPDLESYDKLGTF